MLWFFHSSRQQGTTLLLKISALQFGVTKVGIQLYSHFVLQKHLRKIHCNLQEPDVQIYGCTVPALNQTHCNNSFEDTSGIDKAVQTA